MPTKRGCGKRGRVDVTRDLAFQIQINFSPLSSDRLASNVMATNVTLIHYPECFHFELLSSGMAFRLRAMFRQRYRSAMPP